LGKRLTIRGGDGNQPSPPFAFQIVSLPALEKLGKRIHR